VYKHRSKKRMNPTIWVYQYRIYST